MGFGEGPELSEAGFGMCRKKASGEMLRGNVVAYPPASHAGLLKVTESPSPKPSQQAEP